MRTEIRIATGRRAAALLAVLAALALGACRQDMHDQAKLEPLEATAVFEDGAASRGLVEGTVARGFLRADDAFYRGVLPDGDFVTELPLPVTRELLERGRSRFEAFCSPCHDRLGSGRGMVVRRGYKQPASFHQPRLREAAVGYFYTVISNGFGQMSSYAAQIAPRDRWAIAAWVKVLQLSAGAPAELLSADDLERLSAAARAAQAAEAAEAAGAPPAAGEGGH